MTTLTTEQKAQIEAEARAAAAAGTPIEDACRWPFYTQGALHFIAVYALARPPAPPAAREVQP